MEGEDHSAIFKISGNGTLELAAAVVKAPRTECALKISLLTPEVFKRERSHLAKEEAEIGLWGFTYEINNGSGLDEGIAGRIERVAFK